MVFSCSSGLCAIFFAFCSYVPFPLHRVLDAAVAADGQVTAAAFFYSVGFFEEKTNTGAVTALVLGVYLFLKKFMVLQVMSFMVQVKWLVDGWLVNGFQICVLDVFRQSRRSTANLHPLLYVAVGFFFVCPC